MYNFRVHVCTTQQTVKYKSLERKINISNTLTYALKIKYKTSVNTGDYKRSKRCYLLMHKKSFGLFKNHDFFLKKIKQSVLTFLERNKSKNNDSITKKIAKIFFFKKFNKFFFRDNRRILYRNVSDRFKKYTTESFKTKKLNHFVKKNWHVSLDTITVLVLLMRCHFFYTVTDCKMYIQTFGVLNNNLYVYNVQKSLVQNDSIQLISSEMLFKFLKKRKLKFKKIFKKTKMYKYRVKYQSNNNVRGWTTLKNWFSENLYVFFLHNCELELDCRSLTVVYLPFNNNHDFYKIPTQSEVSPYMMRLHNWKYLT